MKIMGKLDNLPPVFCVMPFHREWADKAGYSELNKTLSPGIPFEMKVPWKKNPIWPILSIISYWFVEIERFNKHAKHVWLEFTISLLVYFYLCS
jgi:hypothetical protein